MMVKYLQPCFPALLPLHQHCKIQTLKHCYVENIFLKDSGYWWSKDFHVKQWWQRETFGKMMEGLHLGFKRGIQQLYPNSLASKWSKTSHASVWSSCWLIPSGIVDWTGKFTSRNILKKRCINFEVRLFFKWINWICLLLDFIGTNNLLYVQLGNIMCAFFWRVKLYCISGKISDRYLKSKVLVVMLSSCENVNYKIICYSKYWCEILFLPLILILTYIICHENRDSFFFIFIQTTSFE